MTLDLPAAVTARVELPASEVSQGVLVGGKPAPARRSGGYWVLEKDVAGAVTIEER